MSVTVRLDPVLLARVDAESTRRKLTRTEVIESILVGRYPSTRPPEAIAAAGQERCDHPKDKLTSFKWGTVCGLCGLKIR